MIDQTMTAIAIEGGKGEASALKPVSISTPSPASGEILIRVHAAGVNRPDIVQRLGAYPPPPGAPETLGLEVAGEVVALGEGAERWKVGDKVVALLGGGGYAQYAVVDARHALPLPHGLSYAEGAGLPETVFTVWANVFESGRLQPGETLVVHAATSGIGATAVQMGKAMRAKVIATGRGADKAAQALKLGADIAVDSTTEDFGRVIKGEGGADVILDMVGGDYMQKNIDALNTGGRLVNVAFLGGAVVEVNLIKVLMKHLTITGSTLRPRHADEKARLAHAIETNVWPWIEAGKFAPTVDRTFPLEKAADAHAYLEAGAHVGKVILTA